MKPIFLKRAQSHGSIYSLVLILFSVILAFVLCAGLIAMAGKDPIQAYQTLFSSVFGRDSGIIETLIKGTPLLLAGLGMVVAFKAKVWNVGGEGQIYIGALSAAWVGINVSGLPHGLHLPLALLAGAAGGSLWALIPAVLKVYFKVSEVITTLMLNYIAIFFVSWLVHGPMEEVGGFMPQTPRIAETAVLPLIVPPTRLHAGVILAVAAALLVFFLLRYTSLGYNIRAVGANPNAAEYSGVKTGPTVILVMLISGSLTGLAGANEILGFHYRLMDGFSPGYGFTAMVVALLGRLNPIGVIASGYLFAGLYVGAAQMQRVMQVPIALSQVIQGLVVLCVLGTEIMLDYDFVPFKRLARQIRDWVPGRLKGGRIEPAIKESFRE